MSELKQYDITKENDDCQTFEEWLYAWAETHIDASSVMVESFQMEFDTNSLYQFFDDEDLEDAFNNALWKYTQSVVDKIVCAARAGLPDVAELLEAWQDCR